MSILSYFLKPLFAFVSLVMATMPAAAQSITAPDVSSAFNNGAVTSRFSEDGSRKRSYVVLSEHEMRNTTGEVAPVVVYGLMVGSRVVYVGITSNLARRVAQHDATKTFTSVRTFTPTLVPRTTGRVVEQNVMNFYNTINMV